MAKKATSKKSSAKKTEKAVVKKAEKVEKVKDEIVEAVAKSEKSIAEQVMKPDFLASIIVELIGTFLLAGVILVSQGQPIAIFFGLTAIVLLAGKISGAHVNPLITVGAWATRQISSVKAAGYVIAQVLGSMLAFVSASAFVNGAPEVSAELAAYGQQKAQLFTAGTIPEGKEWLVLLAEIIGSFIFAFAVAQVVSRQKESSAVALGVGGGLFTATLIAGSMAKVIGGAAIINPAVAVALQAFTVQNQNVSWAIAIYVGGALLGGVLGFALSVLVNKASKDEK